MTAQAAHLDTERLGPYLAGHVPGFGQLVGAEKFAGGQSNPTFLIASTEGRFVLRRKPPGTLLKSAHAVDREYRVMAALAHTDVPVPRVLHLCDDETIIGSMFYVMDYVEGRIFWDGRLPDLPIAERSAIYDSMNAALAALHRVDPAAVGLADYGKPGSYFERQIARWTGQYRASETHPIPAMDDLIAWLEGNMPEDDGRVSLVHGDYRLDNMIFESAGTRILAVLDWELSTLGHPLADLAYQCMQWRLPSEGAFRGLGGIDRKAHGIPTEAEYVELYCRRTGTEMIGHWPFYLAFSFFRLAAILQGVYKRSLDGNASNPERARLMGEAVPMMAGMALEVVGAR
ncbi:phosphotransferase family protein [Microvirga sp. CF3062]|uniref:phosphotransferase family protein n=1 Tax=Microvirga sp. CF3062 TaxID=3110182 RepID=UPI002E78725A|nr:phosphotransferase family protein [Microvirga sp. CF3062]MEE1656064.1 phosphotransferase family protein [Microvirga sp. CF3062]